MEEFESVLFVARECFVYRIPPRASSAGYRAAEWGDLEAFIWKGRLRIVAKADTCEIRMEDAGTGELFAASPYDVSGSSVEAVLDSSRYFVLRVESVDPGSGKTRKAYIGMGFQDRSDAFDFNVALQDWTKRVKRQKAAAEAERWAREHPDEAAKQVEEEGPSPHIPSGPKQDLSLKDGQTFSIKLPGRKRDPGESSNLLSFDAPPPARAGASAESSSGLGGFGGGLLPPPPSRKR